MACFIKQMDSRTKTARLDALFHEVLVQQPRNIYPETHLQNTDNNDII